MIFKERKIPKHLIIQEEYELRKKPRSGFLRIAMLLLLVVGVTYAVSAGMLQL